MESLVQSAGGGCDLVSFISFHAVAWTVQVCVLHNLPPTRFPYERWSQSIRASHKGRSAHR